MNAALKLILERVSTWPEHDQEELAELAREIEARRTGVYMLDDDERAAIENSTSEAREGKFASDAEVARIFKKARLPQDRT